MRWQTPLVGVAIGAAIGYFGKKDAAKGALWGGAIGLGLTLIGGAAVSVGGVQIRVGAGDSDVSRAQTMLNQLGYHVPTDGALGPTTVAALKQFQKTFGLPVDGAVSPQTLNLLRSYTMAGPAGAAPWATSP